MSELNVSARLEELGIELPVVPDLPASTNPNRSFFAVHGDLVFVSGVGPIGERGCLGDDLDVEAGYAAARRACLYMLRRLHDSLGSLDGISHWVKVLGFVRSTPDFDQQPSVLNGFSDLLVEVFGDAGRCARSAIGTGALPLGMPVEVEAILVLRSE
jgi:enamine deaminase RidA (YjgF/YER057c/UK114 family)